MIRRVRSRRPVLVRLKKLVWRSVVQPIESTRLRSAAHTMAFLQRVARRNGFEFHRIAESNPFTSAIYAMRGLDPFFLQIGANDGRRADPLYPVVSELDLAGVAVEPIRDYFEVLERTYGGTRVHAVNCAIFSESGDVEMHRVRPDADVADWAHGIASLDPQHYKKSGTASELMTSETVRAMTYDQLIATCDIDRIDILQIDTEGYDYELIKMFPFDRFQPRVIQFEHGRNHDVMSEAELGELVTMLLAMKYRIAITDYDCVAFV